MEAVRTETTKIYRCCCRLKAPDGTFYDRCGSTVSGPDEPICNICTQAGHPEHDNFDPAIPNQNRSNP